MTQFIHTAYAVKQLMLNLTFLHIKTRFKMYKEFTLHYTTTSVLLAKAAFIWSKIQEQLWNIITI